MHLYIRITVTNLFGLDSDERNACKGAKGWCLVARCIAAVGEERLAMDDKIWK
jgi:hypothetical protein